MTTTLTLENRSGEVDSCSGQADDTHTDTDREIRVLLADAHPMVSAGAALVLGNMDGIDVVGTVGDAWEAARAAEELSLDVVLMDIDLLEPTGLGPIQRILSEASEPSVLILTSDDRADTLHMALATGASGYVFKWASIESFALAIRAAFTKQAFIIPRAARRLVERTLAAHPGDRIAVLDKLSPRELQVLSLLAEPYANNEIADILRISPYTVRTHCQRIMKKLGIHRRAGLVRYALEAGMVSSIPASTNNGEGSASDGSSTPGVG